MKNIKELMEWRFACKHFDANKKISETDLKDILDTTRLAPSSFGLQAWKLVAVTNQDLKNQLAPVCYNQPQITEASALVFLCARTDLMGEQGALEDYLKVYEGVTGKTEQEMEGFKNMVGGRIAGMPADAAKIWIQKQVYIPVQTLILAAAEKAIDSCPMEGFDPNGVAKVLGLPENVVPTVLVSLGYRNMEAPQKVRFPFADIVEIRA